MMKLVVSRTAPANPDTEVYITEKTFWDVASRMSTLITDYFKDRIYIPKKYQENSLVDLSHLTKLIKTIYNTLIERNIDITEIVREAKEKQLSDVEVFLRTAEKVVNQEINLDELFSDYEAKRLAVLWVCHATPDTIMFCGDDWLKIFAEGGFTEQAIKERVVSGEKFCFYLKES